MTVVRAFIAAALAFAPLAAHAESEAAVAEAPLTIGTTYTLQSATYGDEREINVWTPLGYAESDEPYPVLFLLDGGMEQDFHHISGLAQLSWVNGNYKDLIVVGIGSKTRMNEFTSKPTDPRYVREPMVAGGSDTFRAFLADELIPFIEAKYRVGERRALIGESLAALFVTETFLKAPDLFTDYIAVSPSLWWDDRRLAKDAPALLAKHGASSRKLYLTMADEGGTMQSGLDMVVAALEAGAPEGLDWTYKDRRETEHHWTIYHGAALDALRWAFGLPDPDLGEAPWYLVEGANPPDWDENQ